MTLLSIGTSKLSLRLSTPYGLLTSILAILGWLLWVNSVVAQGSTPLDIKGMAAELDRLERICVQLGKAPERALVQQWLVNDKSDAQVLYLPVPADPLIGDDASTGSDPNLLRAFLAARKRHAQYWYDLAKTQAAAGDEWQSYLSLWHAAREDSTHAESKRTLGPLLSGMTLKAKPRSASTAHPQFGWEGGSYVRVETANFKVTSHCDTKTTLAIAQKLEEFYVLWTQAFYPLWAPPNVTANRLAGRNTNWSKRNQIDVVICKDREDYLKTLKVGEANIGVSVGYYSPDGQMSFFYPDPSLDATLYHELTHQLLAEASQLKGGSNAGKGEGFWLVEAIALYMESLTKCKNHWRLGGWQAARLQSARYRALHDGFWIEPEKLQALTLDTWKEQPDLAQLYTHAAGLAHCFLDKRLRPIAGETIPAADDENAIAGREHLDKYDSDKSKATFFRAIVSVYQGQPVSKDLWELLGNQPQRSYVHYLLVRDRHLQSGPSPAPIDPCRDLVLSRSQLNSDSWREVGKFLTVEWLDLSYSNATAANLGWLGELTDLQRLSLEGLPVDGSVLHHISHLTKLKELDLSGCPIDDEQLKELGRLPELETIWLEGTKVTDTGRQWLKNLPKLKL